MSPTAITEVTLPNGDTVPVVPAELARETAETERLRVSARKAGTNAAAKALASGIPVTVVRDGVLIRINPDRTETILEAKA